MKRFADRAKTHPTGLAINRDPVQMVLPREPMDKSCLEQGEVSVNAPSCLSISSLKKRTLWDLPIWKWEAMVLALVSGHLVSSCVVGLSSKWSNGFSYCTGGFCTSSTDYGGRNKYNAGEEECGDASRTTELQHVNAPSNDLRERLLPKGDRSMKSGRSTDHPKIGGSADLAGRRINQKSALALNIGRMMDIIQHETLSTLDEKILDSNLEDGSSMEIGNEGQAKEVAKKIFLNVAKPGSKQICKDDLMQFMNKDEAAKIINRAAPGKRVIDETSLESWVINAFKERKALARSLNDTNTAVDDLHNMLNVLVAIITAVIWLIILGVPIMQFLVFISSQFLLLAFVGIAARWYSKQLSSYS
ncbi:mechanosensitive ion channel protein 6-like [Eucalyptus grandis]|uniref:mechanosensitive ion channel protein 6-like n=1 Tax=Eucalyptus grandis TaxID=71139 RepID=UPI00192E9247|nr:mechanosensitive ion channel protein 6-like [Eucalyptus grandis]